MSARDQARKIILLNREAFAELPKHERGTVIAMVFSYFATLYSKIAPFLGNVEIDDLTNSN